MTRHPIDADDIRIRRAEPEDHEAVMATMATPQAVRGTLQLPMPSRAQWRDRLSGLDRDAVMLVAEVREAGAPDSAFQVVGHGGLQPGGTSVRRRHAMGLGMSVRDDWQGRGVGSALLAALIDRADHWMQVLRLELTVFCDNEAAIALYRRHGFVVEGTHRAYALRDGQFVDALAMARLHPNPPQWPVIDQGPSP